MQQEIAADYVKSGVDIFIGAGEEHFNNRKDGRNLIEELKRKDYQVIFNVDDIAKVKSGRIAGLLPEIKAPQRGDQEEQAASQLSIS
jgi:alkaline phosphatase